MEGTRGIGASCFSELPDLLVRSHDAYLEFGFQCLHTVIRTQPGRSHCLWGTEPGPRSLEYLLSGPRSPAL